MPRSQSGTHWGDDRAIHNDDEARDRLLDAAQLCIVRRGGIAIRMAEVAAEAEVARSTVYRYYASRDELILALVLRRTNSAFERWTKALKRPHDAAVSIRQLVLKPVAAVDSGDPLNDALYAGESAPLVPILEAGTDDLIDAMARPITGLFEQWKADGQIHADLDLRETVEWMSAMSSFLLTTHWRHRSAAAKRRFVDRYFIRALVC